MRLKITSLIFLFLITNVIYGQVKFQVKELNADSLVELIPNKEGTDLVEALNLLSNVICRKDIDRSINLATRAIELSEKLEYQKGLADGYYNLGNAYFLLDDLQPTISNYLKACRFYEDLDPCIEYGRCCLQIALLNYFTRGPEESPPYFDKAVKTIYGIGGKEDKYSISFVVSHTHKVLFPPNPDSIIYYGLKAISYIDTVVDHNEVAFVYSDFGDGYLLMSDLTKALYWYTKALKLQFITDDLKITLLTNIARTHLMFNTEKHTSEAILYLHKAMEIPDTCVGVFGQKSVIYQMLGSISYKKGNYIKAINFYRQGIQIAEERLSSLIINEYRDPIHGYNYRYHIKYNRPLLYEGIYDAYLKLGKYDKALEYYILSKQKTDEVFLEQNQNLITLLEAVSIDEKNKGQIELLASENELQKMKAKQTRTLMLLLVGSVIFFFLITFIIIRQRKIRSEQKLLHDLEIKRVESEKLKELDQLKSSFFANISHEFRTPLTLILSPTEKLLSKITDKNHRNELLLIHRYARRLRRLINQLLNLSKLEAGKLKLNAKTENIVKLVKDFTQSFESLAKQRQTEVLFNTDSEEVIGTVDRDKLEIIINNLLSNAFKFTPEGGRIEVKLTHLDSRCHFEPSNDGEKSANIIPQQLADSSPGLPGFVMTEEKGGKEFKKIVEIKISDTGRGIPTEHIEHIFERFYLVDEANSHQHEGTGIGLALVKELVELHHGEIQVESEINKGATFTIILPVEVSDQTSEDIEQTESFDILEDLKGESLDTNYQYQKLDKKFEVKESDENLSNPVLLIVEDNPDLRAHICYHLSDKYNIIEAQNGEEGLSEAINTIPDIIISDVMMPKMDGYELSKKLKTDERTSHIPVILLTARASKESKIEGLETGADDFITKPFDMDELLIRVRNLIEQRRRFSELLEKKIQKSHGSQLIDFEDSGITSMDEQFLEKIFAVLKEHYSDPEFNVELFCKLVGLSRIQLHRKIKALARMSTSEFIRAYRLNRAAWLIKEQSATIAEIAYDVGFSSPSYFAECFKKQFGKSPSEYSGNK